MLRLDFQYEAGNSGVQVRSDDLGDHQVYGYQVEIAAQNKMGLWHHSLLAKDDPAHEARFFMATATGDDGELGGSGELSDLQWIPIANAGDFAILDVTEFMLGEIRRRLENPAETATPLFAYRLDRPFVRYD